MHTNAFTPHTNAHPHMHAQTLTDRDKERQKLNQDLYIGNVSSLSMLSGYRHMFGVSTGLHKFYDKTFAHNGLALAQAAITT